MDKVIDCLGLGIAPIDILLQIPRYPQPGNKIDALNITIQGGGPIPTAMVTLSCLGLKTGLIAAVGEDILGDFVIEELESKGVDTSLIITKKNSTAIAVGWIEYNSGRRTIALNLKIQIKARDIRIGKLPTTRSVHLDGRDLPACMKLASWAQNNDIPDDAKSNSILE
ncbi:MAG: PfkB family carbohydrate kinase [candidate division Zixibacteria bacterium]|nr:PfkB family carbohydrate kinase [candidate division Zixibacteria bacterium]